MALVGAALPRLASPASVVALSAVVAEFPTAGMAAYSASKAALSAYLAALRREVRRDGVAVLDVRPGHLDTPFASRALTGADLHVPLLRRWMQVAPGRTRPRRALGGACSMP